LLRNLQGPDEQLCDQAAGGAKEDAEKDLGETFQYEGRYFEYEDVPENGPGDGNGRDRGDHDEGEGLRGEVPQKHLKGEESPSHGRVEDGCDAARRTASHEVAHPFAGDPEKLSDHGSHSGPEPIVIAAVTVRSATVLGLMIPPPSAIVSIAAGTPSPFASLGK
jgi:hypothetical protein